MNQREVTDNNDTRWTCVQAYNAAERKISAKAAQLSETNDGKVPVVCTPSGGAQSVRLHLDKNWIKQVSEADLITEIEAAATN